jgi:xanthine dehydrogenase accessory factor
MMTEFLLAKLQEARARGTACCVATVAQTKGSAPRQAGAKMLVHADGRVWGTVGGGKFEALVIENAIATIGRREPLLKTFPLHEADAESFGAICGGEATVFFEPVGAKERLIIVGAGHCGAALASLARSCGLHVTVLDDRAPEDGRLIEADASVYAQPPATALAEMDWDARAAIVLVSRNFEVDRESLAAVLPHAGAAGYIGMIGSRRKVERVMSDLRARGFAGDVLQRVYAPIGLDIGADSPAEIAVSVLAEVLQVLRGRPGGHLRR